METLAIIGMVIGVVCIVLGLIAKDLGFTGLGVAFLFAQFNIYTQAGTIETLETAIVEVGQSYQALEAECDYTGVGET